MKMDVDVAKLVCLFTLFASTFFFGCIPYFILTSGGNSPKIVKTRDIVISYLKCFGGGVFMGACLMNLLPEGMHEMEKYLEMVDIDTHFPVFSTIVALGFFIIALVELVTHSMLHRHSDHGDHHDTPEQDKSDDKKKHRFHGDSTLIKRNGIEDDCVNNGSSTVVLKGLRKGSMMEMNEIHQRDPHDIHFSGGTRNEGGIDEMGTDNQDQGHDEVNDIMTAIGGNPLRAFLLLAALSFHTIFDGLAVGLKTTTNDVWQIFVAIVIHKSLVSVCLGLQLFLVYKDKALKGFLWTAFFSAIAPIGTGVGMLLTSGDIDHVAKQLTNTFLQGLATGTFLYVTFFEILKEELVDKRGFLRLFVVALGFVVMGVITYYSGHEDDVSQEHGLHNSTATH